MKRTIYSKYYSDTFLYNHLLVSNNTSFNRELHTHAEYEILYLKSGKLQYIEDSSLYNVTSDSLILTRPGKLHSVSFEGTSYDRYDILFDVSELNLSILNKIPDKLTVISCESYPNLSSLFEKMDLFFTHFAEDELYNILHCLVEELFYTIIAYGIKPDENDESMIYYSTLTKAISYIDTNIAGDLSLDIICEHLHITKSYLHRIFMEKLHVSPKKYINIKRFSQAQNAIRLGSNPTAIYSQLGFSDYSTFFRGYKKHYGYSPSEEYLHTASLSSMS